MNKEEESIQSIEWWEVKDCYECGKTIKEDRLPIYLNRDKGYCRMHRICVSCWNENHFIPKWGKKFILENTGKALDNGDDI